MWNARHGHASNRRQQQQQQPGNRTNTPNIHINPNFRAQDLLNNINRATSMFTQRAEATMPAAASLATHVNPRFLERCWQRQVVAEQSPNIFVNPRFLGQSQAWPNLLQPQSAVLSVNNNAFQASACVPNIMAQHYMIPLTSTMPAAAPSMPTATTTMPTAVPTMSMSTTTAQPQRKILEQTRTKIVREPLEHLKTGNVLCPEPMIKVNKRKLIRRKAPTAAERLQDRQAFFKAKGQTQQQHLLDRTRMTYNANVNATSPRMRSSSSKLYVNNAKQRSVNFLKKSLVKSDLPCAIYRKVGKCAKHEKGKCNKVHDPRQITICTRFLRNDCNKPHCPLSHNVCLSKMPVCRFYLQGSCVREDCPYLHKKVSDKTELCADFLSGFCPLGGECLKRHEFICQQFASTGVCIDRKCIYCMKRKCHENINKQKPLKLPKLSKKIKRPVLGVAKCTKEQSKQKPSNSLGTKSTRYFDVENEGTETIFIPSQKRDKLGVLPSYIPL